MRELKASEVILKSLSFKLSKTKTFLELLNMVSPPISFGYNTIILQNNNITKINLHQIVGVMPFLEIAYNQFSVN
ncbi:hypothetical protein XO12_07510 [Marinitoga sp. 1154]|nr:hypothetical protein [Marinitoga sp. 1154]